MQGTPQEESRDPPAPPAASQCGPHSLMFRPTGGRVSSLALHLCSAAFLCVSAQHAFASSPVMNSEVMGCVWKCWTLHQKRSKVTSAQSLQQHQTELIKVCKCPPRRLTSALHEH
ncbi:unnamed protein product [Gadus morhua 'NCC']